MLLTDISIHVPAWGTTQLTAILAEYQQNFNPRSRVGNDEALRNLLVGIMNFNPRSRVGNDGENLWRSQVLHHFNPRSRVGNDESLDRNCSTLCNFNPRSRVGNDDEFVIYTYFYIDFNPRSRVGNDVTYTHSGRILKSNFNPRSRVGNDCACLIATFYLWQFQSTFPRGERQGNDAYAGFQQVFQSTFPRGERPEKVALVPLICYFNPRSRVGNDQIGVPVQISDIKFQSTFPRGERLVSFFS